MVGIALPETLIGLHFIAAGAQSTITRMAARRRMSDDTVLYLTSASTVCISGGALLIILWFFPGFASWDTFPVEEAIVMSLIFVGIGVVYFVVSKLRYRSQGMIPSYVYEPLARLHVFIVVPFSIWFLEDNATPRELFAIGLALAAILLIGFRSGSGDKAGGSGFFTGLCLLVLAGLYAAALQILAKVLMTPDLYFQVPVLVYILGSNLVTTCLSGFSHFRPKARIADRRVLVYGCAAGLCNTVALGSLLYFLIDGKASRIYSIGAMSMLIPVAINLLGSYERRPRRMEVMALVCALGAILLQTSGDSA